MRFAIIATLAAAATVATVPTVAAQNDQRIPRATTNAPAATKSTATKDGATGEETSLTTLEQQKTVPYRACINARGWVNGRLLCDD